MKKFVVRYGAMRYLGIVEVSEKAAVGFIHGTPVVIKTPRGQEAATVLTETDEEKIAKIPNLVGDPLTFIRRTTREDEERIAAIKAEEKNNFNRCLKIVERMRVELTLVRVEQIFGRERVVVYYVADGRVDFRELVRALAAEFQTRIEMKQIGVRDETKLLADVGDCGREVCCNTFLATMPPVSMKMAKLQKATLDPTKVSGRCGRLKCCLRYEFDAYYELQEASPAIWKTGAGSLSTSRKSTRAIPGAASERTEVLTGAISTNTILISTTTGGRKNAFTGAANARRDIPAAPCRTARTRLIRRNRTSRSRPRAGTVPETLRARSRNRRAG